MVNGFLNTNFVIEIWKDKTFGIENPQLGLIAITNTEIPKARQEYEASNRNSGEETAALTVNVDSKMAGCIEMDV